MCSDPGPWTLDPASVEGFLVDPHQGPGLVGFALVLDAAELVPELAVLPLVVVVVLGLPDRLERSRLVELDGKNRVIAIEFCVRDF